VRESFNITSLVREGLDKLVPYDAHLYPEVIKLLIMQSQLKKLMKLSKKQNWLEEELRRPLSVFFGEATVVIFQTPMGIIGRLPSGKTGSLMTAIC
jgi:hypothetical protein